MVIKSAPQAAGAPHSFVETGLSRVSRALARPITSRCDVITYKGKHSLLYVLYRSGGRHALTG